MGLTGGGQGRRVLINGLRVGVAEVMLRLAGGWLCADATCFPVPFLLPGIEKMIASKEEKGNTRGQEARRKQWN